MSTGSFWTWTPALLRVKCTYDRDTGDTTDRIDLSKSVKSLHEAGAEEVRAFYEALVHMPWLSKKMRDAIMAELAGSVRTYKHEHAKRTIAFIQDAIAEEEAAIRAALAEEEATPQKRQRKRGKRNELLRGSVHEKAIENVATFLLMTAENLTKRLQRYGDKQKKTDFKKLSLT